MAMDENRAAENYKTALDSFLSQHPYDGGLDSVRALERILDQEFQSAEPTNPNIDITTPAGTLNFGDLRSVEPKSEVPWILAREIARYWSTTIEPTGEPVSCDSIDSVENDAIKIIEPIATDLVNAIDRELHYPPFYDFFHIIFKHVREIIWTVKESDGGGCSETIETKVL